MNPAAPSIEVTSGIGNSLERFCERVRTADPFLVNRVDRPVTEELIDVFGIHETEYRRLLNLGRQAHQEHQGIGVTVWGEAGVGKTHLLARLGKWAHEQRHAQFVYLHNLQADPERLPRDLLQAVLGSLTGGRMPPQHRSPLFALLNAVLRHALKSSGQARPGWTHLDKAYQELILQWADRDPSRGVLFDAQVYAVLFRYYQAAHPAQRGKGERTAANALRWLAGESLSDAERTLLGLRPEAGATIPSPSSERQHVKRVLVALTQLAASAGQLFLLCLDQVDNLEENQIRALARFLHDLLDSAGNLLIVTTGVRETMLGFLEKGVITETSWDRIGQVEILLNRISMARGRELLLHRLQRFMACAHGLPDVAEFVARDPLFPLGTSWFEERVRHLPDFRPRDLLGWATQRWQQHQETLTTTPGAIWLARLLSEPIAANYPVFQEKPTLVAHGQETQVVRKSASPPNEDRLRELVCTLLEEGLNEGRCPGLTEVQKLSAGGKGTYPGCDILLHQSDPDGRELRVGLRFLVTADGRKVVAALRRLLDDSNPPDRVVLITDDRQKISLGPVGEQHLAKLRERGRDRFQQLDVTSQELVELETLLNASVAGRPVGELKRASSFLSKLLQPAGATAAEPGYFLANT